MAMSAPFLFKVSRFKGVYQNLEEQDEDGNIVPLKMQASKEFRTHFNEFVHCLLLDCVNNARSAGRKMMQPEDVPSLQQEDQPPVPDDSSGS